MGVNEHIEYKCSECGVEKPREELTVKRVQFATMGVKFRNLRTRTVAWLCEDCREKEPAWMRSSLADAPGMTNTKLNPKKS